MNKTVKVILNILIVIAGLFFFMTFIYMIESIKYENRDVVTKSEQRMNTLDYEIRMRAFDGVLDSYHLERADSLESPEEMEDLYNVGGYAETAFFKRVYEEKGDKDKVKACADNMKRLRGQLGAYEYAADQIDEIISSAPKIVPFEEDEE